MEEYRPRLVDGLIEELFREVPALLLIGPRAAGKTTTGRRHARTVVRLDREADAAPDQAAARHLRWLRDELGDRFVAGIVFHTGPRIFKLDDGIVAAPLCALWG